MVLNIDPFIALLNNLLCEDHSSVHTEASETETRQLVVVPVNENSVSVAASQSNEYKSEVNNDMSSDSKRQ